MDSHEQEMRRRLSRLSKEICEILLAMDVDKPHVTRMSKHRVEVAAGTAEADDRIWITIER